MMRPAPSARMESTGGAVFLRPSCRVVDRWGTTAALLTPTEPARMKAIMDHVITLLEENDLDCLVLEEDVALKTGMAGHHGQWTCNIEVLRLTESVYAFGAMSRSTQLVPPEARAGVLVLMNLVNNYGAPVGNFQLDPSDGEVVFRTSIPFELPDELAPELLAHTLYINWAEIDRFLPAISAVLEGVDPEEAFEQLAATDED